MVYSSTDTMVTPRPMSRTAVVAAGSPLHFCTTTMRDPSGSLSCNTPFEATRELFGAQLSRRVLEPLATATDLAIFVACEAQEVGVWLRSLGSMPVAVALGLHVRPYRDAIPFVSRTLFANHQNKRFMLQFGHLLDAWRSVVDFEQRLQQPFTWVLRVRADLVYAPCTTFRPQWLHTLPINAIGFGEPPTLSQLAGWPHSGVSDKFAIGTRDAMEWYLTLAKEYNSEAAAMSWAREINTHRCNEPMSKTIFGQRSCSAERVLAKHLCLTNHSVVWLPMRLQIVRKAVGENTTSRILNAANATGDAVSRLLAAAAGEYWRREHVHDSPNAPSQETRYDSGLRDGSSLLIADRMGVRSTLRMSLLLPVPDHSLDVRPADYSSAANVSVDLCHVRVPPWMSSSCLYDTPRSCCPFVGVTERGAVLEGKLQSRSRNAPPSSQLPYIEGSSEVAPSSRRVEAVESDEDPVHWLHKNAPGPLGSCALVGSSRSMRGHQLGHSIDRHPTVIRINRLGYSVDEHVHIGQRTDILFTTLCNVKTGARLFVPQGAGGKSGSKYVTCHLRNGTGCDFRFLILRGPPNCMEHISRLRNVEHLALPVAIESIHQVQNIRALMRASISRRCQILRSCSNPLLFLSWFLNKRSGSPNPSHAHDSVQFCIKYGT